jgi:hypothetical protein
MRMGEAGERIEWKRGEGVGCLGKTIEGRKAELRKRRYEGLAKISQLMLMLTREEKRRLVGRDLRLEICWKCWGNREIRYLAKAVR